MSERSDKLRAAVEATRLGFGLTEREATEAARGAVGLGAGGICLPILFLPAAATVLEEAGGRRPDLVTVANFPGGDHTSARVRADVMDAVRAGADHIDLVVPGRHVRERRWERVTAFVRDVCRAADDAAGRAVPFKAILETAALSDEEIRGAADACVAAGALWLKTSTGFHPQGGATAGAVRLLRAIAPAQVGVKASGGIRTREDALAMLAAGADRIGTSAERTILG